jgi:S-DNA-T family DNA segregation ATPase FtsK/SpoIIIE
MPAKREANRFKKKTPAPAKPAVRRKGPAPRRAPRNPDREPRQWIKLPSIPKPQLGSISPERKLDIAGSVIALVGLLTLLSLLSIQRGLLTGLWIKTLANLFGWGVYVLPIGLMAVGLWLVFRHIEHIPIPSLERLVGIILLYCNLLAWISLTAGNSWDLAKAGKGGGYIGAVIERALVIGLGKPGALVALLAWLIIGLAFSFDLSIPELLQKTQPLTKKISQPLQRHNGANSNRPYIHHTPRRSAETPDSDVPDIPTDFQPLPDLSQLDASKPLAAAGEASAVSALQPASSSTANEEQPEGAASGAGAAAIAWQLPVLDEMLDPASPAAAQGNVDEERVRILEETLASFGAPGHVVEIHHGPTFTQYGIEPDYVESRGGGRIRVRVSKINGLADDLALALAASRIRIQAPVPGKSYVGIEVPNTEISRVALLELMQSEAYQRIGSNLRFALGKDVAGKPKAYDLTAMPHLLIAGTTGSGKSVCINTLLCCFLLNNTPADLRLVLVDPKRVELTGYNHIPHLLAPVVVNSDRVVGALQWMIREMDSRYHKLSKNKVRNIQEFNERFPEEKLPYLVMVIDELADLMMLAPDETERCITRLAQLARATGIHLILATQRPSVNVVTGLIKANFPARIAFAVASQIDSRVILDQPGADRLLGRGDMLFQAPDASSPVRLQGAYVSDNEIRRVVDYWKASAAQAIQSGASPISAPVDTLPRGVPLKQTPLWDDMDLKAPDDEDPLLDEAIGLVRRQGRASITMLQKRLRVGYTRAARLVDAMEQRGIVSPMLPNSQIREVLDYGDGAPPIEEQTPD